VLGIVIAGLGILSGLDVLYKDLVNLLELRSKVFGGGDGKGLGRVRRHVENWVDAVISEERGTIDRRLMRIVVREFGDGEELVPIVLLVVAVDTEILFDGLIHAFSLAVRLGVKGGG